MSEDTAVLPRSAAWLAPVCLAGAVFLWGTSFMAAKTALTGFSPSVLVWLRMTLAALTVPFLLGRIPKPDYRPGDWKILSLLCLMQPCLYFLLESHALNLTTSSQAGMVSSLVPLFVAAGARAILGEPMTRGSMLGLAVSMAGVVWLSAAGAPAADAPDPALGNLLEVGAMVCAAVYMVVMKRLSARYSTWWLTGLQCVAGALFFLPGGLGNLSGLADAPAAAWIAVAYLGLFVTLGAFGLYNMAMTLMPAGRAALSINLVPLVALGAGWLLLGETLAPVQLAACGVVGVGVWLGRR
ncbi:DMT family transporter [Desulfovibrio sp. Huiquan2017]|uniref:DMT family transporter n=1 Tax=Desulfovibrio sp. Huiquan2017 TaxID=2816861 RepID=UPI001A924353|nr:DMT family transporter [Desulfovibrio sp. Huiquan2017]